MFRFFETLVDPYQPYVPSDTPPRKLWPFLKEYIFPFRRVFAATGALSVVSAFADVALIWYVGRLVDLLAQNGPQQAWALYGTEILLVAAAILILRPILLVARPCPCDPPARRLVRKRFCWADRQSHHANAARRGGCGVSDL